MNIDYNFLTVPEGMDENEYLLKWKRLYEVMMNKMRDRENGYNYKISALELLDLFYGMKTSLRIAENKYNSNTIHEISSEVITGIEKLREAVEKRYPDQVHVSIEVLQLIRWCNEAKKEENTKASVYVSFMVPQFLYFTLTGLAFRKFVDFSTIVECARAYSEQIQSVAHNPNLSNRDKDVLWMMSALFINSLEHYIFLMDYHKDIAPEDNDLIHIREKLIETGNTLNEINLEEFARMNG